MLSSAASTPLSIIFLMPNHPAQAQMDSASTVADTDIGCRYVLGIDQATSTGFAFAVEGTATILHSGNLQFPGKLGERMTRFENWFSRLLEQYAPSLVVYEAPHFRGQTSTLSCVALVVTMIKVCEATRTPICCAHTQALKKFATGSGGKDVGKDAMIAAANKYLKGKVLVYSKKTGDDDEADAIHLARWGALGCPKNSPAKKPPRIRSRRKSTTI